MSRGNDAVPSWSGFNYQGKITLLEVLISINQLNNDNIRIDNSFYVEIEKTEDFVIYKNNIQSSFNQVKAWLSTNKVSSYMKPLEKLIHHKNSSSNPTAICNLCVANDIMDWEEPVNIYSSSVNLYKYDNKIISVTEVKCYILNEIDKYIAFNNLNLKYRGNIYLNLCALIDEKVAKMHSQNSAIRSYRIQFSDFIECIDESLNDIINLELAKQKENVYDYIVGRMYQYINEFCEEYCQSYGENCKEATGIPCAVKLEYDLLLNINVWEYCKIINPDVIDGWENHFRYIECLDGTKFKDNIYTILSKISDTNVFQYDKNMSYIESSLYETENNRIIPTLLQLRFNEYARVCPMQITLKKIKSNDSVAKYIQGCAITADTNNKIWDSQKDSILYFNDKGKDKVSDLKNSIKIIDKSDLIKRMGENS